MAASVRWGVGSRHPIARPSPHARHRSDAPGSLIVALFVQKYGGSSVADAESIKRVAKRIVDTRRAGHDVVVAVSAMGDTTDELLDLAAQVAPIPAPRELDMLLSSGERISMALLAMAIHSMGFEARSFTGSQAGMITDATHGAARIVDVTPIRLREALDEGAIVIVAGFQGFNRDTRDITTLGRGGSDTTAVALAAALNADVCEIYSDVEGIFTADPACRAPRPEADPRLERGDARAGRQRREGAVHPSCRVRAPARGADPCPVDVQFGGGHVGARQRHDCPRGHRRTGRSLRAARRRRRRDGRADRRGRRDRPQPGQDHRHRRARTFPARLPRSSRSSPSRGRTST